MPLLPKTVRARVEVKAARAFLVGAGEGAVRQRLNQTTQIYTEVSIKLHQDVRAREPAREPGRMSQLRK